MSDKSNGNISFLGALLLLFIGLKLTGHIDWSWWWVFSPLWIFAALVLTLIVVIVSLGLDKKRY